MSSTIGLTTGSAFFLGSITISTAGTYLITAQAGSQNGGGGTTTSAAYYVNNNTAGAGIPVGAYGSTGTIMYSSLPYSNLATGAVVTNLSTIVKITASTTFDFYCNLIFTGNCQNYGTQCYLNYLRVG